MLNLRWDVLTFNAPADQAFAFGSHTPKRRHLLWLLFTDPVLRERFVHWDEQAPAARGACTVQRCAQPTGDGVPTVFDHTSLTIDEDRHLRLVVYARQLASMGLDG